MKWYGTKDTIGAPLISFEFEAPTRKDAIETVVTTFGCWFDQLLLRSENDAKPEDVTIECERLYETLYIRHDG